MNRTQTKPNLELAPGGEVACVWECNLASVRPDLEKQFGQLHCVFSVPDAHGARRVTLHPFVSNRPMRRPSRAGDNRRHDSQSNHGDPCRTMDSQSPMKSHISGTTTKAPSPATH